VTDDVESPLWADHRPSILFILHPVGFEGQELRGTRMTTRRVVAARTNAARAARNSAMIGEAGRGYANQRRRSHRPGRAGRVAPACQDMTTFFETLNDLMATGEPLVTVTVVDTSGSAPQDPGAKMIVTARGRHWGTVGGGKVETRAIAEARDMLTSAERRATQFVQWNLNRDVGMTCGGIVRLYFEAYNFGRWNIVIFGAGHVATALVTLLVHFDCHILCIDPRQEWIERLPRAANLETVVAADMPAVVPRLPDDAFVVLMTMGHTTDKPILIEILRTRHFPYLGAIGSKSKALILRRDVAEAGLSPDLQEAFICPIGLEVGTRNPYEIAVSIIAQMLQRRDALRDRPAAIHSDESRTVRE
jgi:xanthine dehydrogenase accessory factor